MSRLQRQVDRLLRWYPRAWRDANGAFLRGTVLDHADGEDRDRLRVAEAWSIRLNGLGERLTIRSAAWLATAALVVALCSLLAAFSSTGQEWLFLGSATLAPMLLTASLLSIPRAFRWLRPAHTVMALLLAVLAWAAAGIARWSWSAGFDEADAGVAPSALSAAFAPVTLTAWTLGGAAIVIVVMDASSRLSRILRWAAALMAAVVVPPIAGFNVLSPSVTLLLAGATALGALVVVARSEPAARSRALRAPIGTGIRRGTIPFAALALVIAIAGIGAAFTAHLWLPGVDGTRAMQLGTVAGSIAALPLLGGFGWVLTTHLPGRRVEVIVGAGLVGSGLVTSALRTYTGAAASGDLPWGALLPIALGGGLLVAAALPIRLRLRVACAALLGAALFLPAWGVAAMTVFLVPLPAVAMLLWGAFSGRARRQPAALQLA